MFDIDFPVASMMVVMRSLLNLHGFNRLQRRFTIQFVA